MAKKTTIMTEGVIWKQLLFFALPIMGSNLLQQFYSMTDSLIVGRFAGPQALAAVGSTQALVFMVIGFFIGLSSGAGVIVAQHYGARNDENVSKAVHTALAISIISGIGLTIFGVFYSHKLLVLMNCPSDVIDLSTQYLQIYFIGVMGVILYNLGSGILRAVGDSIRPLIFLIVTVILNLFLDVFFVVVLKWGVAGAGWATAISQCIAAILVFILLTRTHDSYQVHLSKIRLDKQQVSSILKVGVPTGSQQVVVSFSNVIIQSTVNGFGSLAMAGIVAAGKIDGFIYMPMNAFGVAITTFVGQNIGAGKLDRVHKGVRQCLMMSIGITILASTIVMLYKTPILALFNDDPEVLRYGQLVVNMLAPAYCIFAVTDAIGGAIRGAGKAYVPMAVTIICLCAFRILWMFFVVPSHHTLFMVYINYPITWFLSSLTLVVYYKKAHWLKGQ